MPSARKFVLIALCDFADESGECFPSIQQLMMRCCMTDRGVQRCIVELVKSGYIRRDFRPGRSTVYVVIDPRQWVAPTSSHPDEASGQSRLVVTPDQQSPPTVGRDGPDQQSGDPDQQSPITTTQPPPNGFVDTHADEFQPSKAVLAAKAMIAAGMHPTKVSANNPLLVQLAEHCKPEEFRLAALYAIDEGMGFKWALGVMRNQLQQKPVTGNHQPSKRHGATDSFKGKNYAGTADEHLPAEFRTAVAGTAG